MMWQVRSNKESGQKELEIFILSCHIALSYGSEETEM